MSTDPTANPNPDEGASSRPSDWTSPPAGSSQQPAGPPPPPPPPAYGQTPPVYGQTPSQPSYTPAPPPAPGYGSGMYAGAQEHPKGTMVLILGILSIVICQVLGPFAWVMGRRTLAEIDTSGRTYTNRSMVQAGMVCGIIGTVLLILALAYILIVVVILGMAASNGSLR